MIFFLPGNGGDAQLGVLSKAPYTTISALFFSSCIRQSTLFFSLRQWESCEQRSRYDEMQSLNVQNMSNCLLMLSFCPFYTYCMNYQWLLLEFIYAQQLSNTGPSFDYTVKLKLFNSINILSLQKVIHW